MSSGTFFVSWALWEQMSFVLGAAIIVVLCAGFVKLWLSNRLIKRHEILDEEKRQRVEEMRRTGLPVKVADNIPFGIRAIQSGIEVDGIWISRGPSPVLEPDKLHSPSTLVGSETSSQRKGKGIAYGARPLPLSTADDERPTRKQSQPERSVLQRHDDVHCFVKSRISFAGPLPHSGPDAGSPRSHALDTFDSDDQERSKSSQSKRAYEAYVPSPPHRTPGWSSQRTSASSSGESVDSDAQYVRGGQSGSNHHTPAYNSRKLRKLHGGHTVYSAVPQGSPSWGKNSGDPFETPLQTPSGFGALSQLETQAFLAQPLEILLPEPTFGPGESHHNRYLRRVSPNFEVLPHGTLGQARPYGDRDHC